MFRRLLPTLLALSVGFAALLLGLAGLQRIFQDERARARSELAGRRRALEQYALEALKQELHRRLSAELPRLKAALEDPLREDQGLYFQEQGEQRLPRRLLPSERGSAQALYLALSGGKAREEPAEEDDPWVTRLELLSRFEAALRRGERGAIEPALRNILAHQARYRLPAEREAPLLVHLLEQLEAHSTPHPRLLSLLLREGVPGPSGAELEGLQRKLLRRRDRFTREELDFFCQRIGALSARAGVRAEDFSARCLEPPGEELGPLPPPPSPSIHLGRVYLEPDSHQVVRGVEVKLSELLLALEAEMRDRALLGPEDRLRLAPSSERTLALLALGLSLQSPSWGQSERQLEGRYRLKTGLLVLSGALAAAIAALGVLLQYRKQRFLELKADFVSTVSHELRTPLASVRVMAETLEKRLSGESAARDYPARIIREVDSLGFLVENILSFNRLDKGRWLPRMALLRLEEVWEPVREEAQSYSQAAVQVSSSGLEGARLWADRELLRVLLQNLVRNACRHNLRDPVELHLAVSSEEGGLYLRLRDNGVGIPPGEQEQVFKEFYRPRSSQGGGSGLGLAICQRIMSVHRGRIRVATSGAEGTTFELYFPRGQG